MDIATHPFADFDFAKLKQSAYEFDNPITQLLADRILFTRTNGGSLSPIDFPTGIGKTHSTMVVLLEYMLHRIHHRLYGDPNPYSLHLPLYITNAVDNVREAYDKLTDLINADERLNHPQKQWLTGQILLLPNNNDILLDLIINHRLPNILNTLKLKPSQSITDQISSVKSLHKMLQIEIPDPIIANTLNANLQKLLPNVFKSLCQLINTANHLKFKTLTLQQISALSQLFPAMRLQNPDTLAVFLTTMKLMHGGSLPFDTRYNFDAQMSQHLLLIDEIDRQNGEIINFLCDQQSVNLLKLACELCVKLPVFAPPTTAEYEGIAKIFTNYFNKLNSLKDRYRLTSSFCLHHKMSNFQTAALFTDYQTTHHASLDKKFWVYFDQDSHTNIIFDDTCFAPDELPDDKYPLYELFNQLSIIIGRDFIFALNHACQKLVSNANKLNLPSDPQMQLNLLFNIYRLDDIRHLIDPLLNFYKNQVITSLTNDGSFHTNGFKLNEIYTPLAMHQFVSFHTTLFTESPTAMIARWIERGTPIIGISATANNQSVIHNFDMAYLERRIDDRLIRISSDELTHINAHYHKLRDYSQIKIDFHSLNGQAESFVRTHCRYFLDLNTPPVIANNAQLQQVWHRLYGDDKSLDDTAVDHRKVAYYLGLLDNYCQAICAFLDNHTAGNRYMMLMLNRLLNDNEREFFQNFLDELSARHQINIVFDVVNSAYLKSNKFDSIIKDRLTKSSDKVIIFTTYQTLSSGANPDYPIHPADRDWICTSALPSPKITCDIDTLYLDLPTHLITVPSYQDENLHSTKLKSLVQIMSLTDAGKVSLSACDDWVKSVLNMEFKRLSRLKSNHYGETNTAHGDYAHAVCRQVEQAIGRINRSSHKRKNPLIFISQKLHDLLKQVPKPTHITTHEYRGLIDFVHQTATATVLPNLALARLQTAANTANYRHHVMIQRFLDDFSKLHQGIPDDTDSQAKACAKIHAWHTLREICLKHPTSIKPEPTVFQYYLKPPTPASSYRFSGDFEGNKNTPCSFFGLDHNSHLISADEMRLNILMQNSIIKNYFIKHDYATTWHDAAEYILTPILANNIYKGALGEAAGKAILEEYGCQLDDLPPEYFELFDYVISYQGKQALIDFKHWNLDRHDSRSTAERETALMHILQKRDFILRHRHPNTDMPSRLIICNILSDVTRQIQQYEHSQVLTIPALIDRHTGQINQDAITAILTFINQSADEAFSN